MKIIIILILCTIIILSGCVVQSPYTDCKRDCKIQYYREWCKNESLPDSMIKRYDCPLMVDLPNEEANKYCYDECK